MDAAYQEAARRPDDAAATGRFCMLLDAHDQFDAAAQCYARASMLDRKNFDWQYHLASVRMAQGRNEDAAAALRKALAIREYRPAALKLAQCLGESGSTDESERILQKLVGEDPGDSEAWYSLGRAQERRGDTAGAEGSYRRACELYPGYGAAHYALALAMQRQGRTDAAREHFRLAGEHKTEVPPPQDSIRAEVQQLAGGTTVLLRRAAAFEKAGRLSDAIRANLAAVEKDPALLQAHINLIALCGRSGEFRQAEQHYREAVRLPGGKLDADYNYGVLLVSQERATEAEEAFRRALAANPQHAPSHYNLGILLERQGKRREALRQFEAAIESQADYRLAHFQLGRILASERQYPPAITHLLQTLKPEDESTSGYLYALSATYARAGKYQAAIQYGERARSEAAARGHTDLLASIERDLQIMKARASGK